LFAGRVFDAQIAVLEYKSIICPGYTAVLHIHSATEEVILKKLICMVDKKTGKPDKAKANPRFVKPVSISACVCFFMLFVCD
jgi:peptide chain release factor subunit 3